VPTTVSFQGEIVTTFKKPAKTALIDPIVHSFAPITLVGGGAADQADLKEAQALAPRCVAADGGAALALAAGVIPEAVIGDFDSLSDQTLAALPAAHLHRIDEQDTTDFEKSLARIAAPVIIGVGFCGGRVDDQLAAFHALLGFAHQPCVLVAETEIILLAPPQLSLPARAGDVVSLVPLCDVQGHSQGLRWPIEGLEFSPQGRIGTSNAATGPVTLSMDHAGMLLILPRTFISAVVRALVDPACARWPVREK
jgi:thiamine pyrophosphokinase